MKAQAGKSSLLTLLITGIAVVLISTTGIARMMGWGPNSADGSDDMITPDKTALVPTTGKARAQPRCPECGVIVAVQEIERHEEDPGPGSAGGATAGNQDATPVESTKSYEIIVRMADGSSRVIDDANPARWRTGERLIVIEGAKQSDK